MDARTTVTVSRRSVLAALGSTGLVGLVAACGGAKHSRAPATSGHGLKKIAYADQHPDQYGVLGLPKATATGLMVLLHGGYWLEQYGAALMDPMATDLRSRGYVTWNLEYRRVGNGGGYPATFTDVAAGIDHTAALGVGDLPVTVIGHSAGGHLAVWAASRTAATPGGSPKITAPRTLSLSGVLDVHAAAIEGLGGGAAEQLMGGTPTSKASDYALADPVPLAPAAGTVVAVHAASDEIVPRSQSTAYVAADQAAGGTASLVLVPGGHFDLIDPTSKAWAQIVTHLG